MSPTDSDASRWAGVAVAIVMMIAGGVGTYWLGIGAIDRSARERDYDIGVAMSEINAKQRAVLERLSKAEDAILTCTTELARREGYIKILTDLQSAVRDLEQALRRHDDRLPPLGRKSGAIEPWKPVGG